MTRPGDTLRLSPFGNTAVVFTPGGEVTVISNFPSVCRHCTANFPVGASNVADADVSAAYAAAAAFQADAEVSAPGFGAMSTLRQPVLPGCCRMPATYAYCHSIRCPIMK